ncbi:MAG: hypothetical protein TECD_00692 [Hyphomicrobiaceae bacterium hypho_1]
MSTEKKKNNFLEIDSHACLQAQTLIRTSRFAALSYLDAETNAPSASQVNVSTDINGLPIFLISSLSIHFKALNKDSRCALMLGVPGKGDPAAYPRIAVMGNAYILKKHRDIERSRRRYLARHPESSLYADFSDFAFWRVEPTHATFIGGYGKAYEVMKVNHIASDAKNCLALEPHETEIIASMNNDTTLLHAINLIKKQTGKWKIISLDCDGIDLIKDDIITRIWFKISPNKICNLRQELIQLSLRMSSS